MNGAYYALIIPQAGPGVPTHPIAPGGQPPRPWGPINYPDQGLPGNQPYPGQGLPGYQPYPDQGLPPPPLGIWGGRPPNYVDIGGPGNQPYPGQGLPGNQPYPGQGLPGWQPGVSHPIAPGGRPPGMWGPIFYPDQGLPSNPPPLYPSQGPGFPTHPIVIPPGDIPEGPVGDDEMVIVIFVPGIGYKMAVVPKPPEVPGYNPPTGPSTERPTPVAQK